MDTKIPLEPQSKMRFKLIINASHEGMTVDVDDKDLMNAIRPAVRSVFRSETMKLDSCSILSEGFSYTDNVEELREMAREKINGMQVEDLLEMIERNS